jgi:hypothetical protein
MTLVLSKRPKIPHLVFSHSTPYPLPLEIFNIIPDFKFEEYRKEEWG